MSRPVRTPAAGRALAASASALLALTLLSGGHRAGTGWPDGMPLETGAVGAGCEHPCPAPRP